MTDQATTQTVTEAKRFRFKNRDGFVRGCIKETKSYCKTISENTGRAANLDTLIPWVIQERLNSEYCKDEFNDGQISDSQFNRVLNEISTAVFSFYRDATPDELANLVDKVKLNTQNRNSCSTKFITKYYEDFNEIQARFSEQISYGDPTDTISWMGDEIAKAQVIRDLFSRNTEVDQQYNSHDAILALIHDHTTEEKEAIIERVVERCRQEVIEYASFMGSSTSPFHNAVNQFQGQAMAEFIRKAEWHSNRMNHLAEEKAELVAICEQHAEQVQDSPHRDDQEVAM